MTIQTGKEFRESYEASARSGPFGHYKRESLGHILNTLANVLHVPLMVVENVQLADQGKLLLHGKPFADYKYFDGIEIPLFRFTGEDSRHFSPVHNPQFVESEGKLIPRFIPTLECHDNPGFEIFGQHATEELHDFLRYPMLSSFRDDESCKLKSDAGAFFQGGSDNPKGQWSLIEFWKPSGVNAWFDYLNDHYRPTKAG